MYAQSKLAFARAWALRDGLGEAHRAALERYVPETLDLADLPAERLLEEREGWVLKRALGRVGDQVFVGMLTSQAYWKGLVEELAALRAPAVGSAGVSGRRGSPSASCGSGPSPPRSATASSRWAPTCSTAASPGTSPASRRVSHVSHDALCVPVFVGDIRPRPRGAAA